MKIIERDYLKELIDVMGTPDIKVITGVRRSGKSKLLDMFKKYIEANIEKVNIISINFNLIKFDKLRDYILLNNYIEENFVPEKKNFVLIDEVQMCKEFERTINSLHAEEKYDIYITGSNAFLLSSDLATLFTGRTYEIQMYPFSFKEYLKYFKYKDVQEAFDKYVFEGGMAGSYVYDDNHKKYNYINDVYNALIVRDIQQKYNIQNIALMDSLTEFMMDNISNLTSYRNVANKLNQNDMNMNTNDKTIASYINYLCDAFAFYKVRRYDIQGKKYLSSIDKYYLVDQTFKYAKLGTKNINYGRVYENIVAIELLRRGYEIYVGTLYNKEVDFVAMKQNEKIYIQVSDNIDDENTLKREVEPLLQIKEAYPKIIIARTRHEDYQYEGVQIYDIANWLMK
ncbi:MAG: ATP-binding protein [Clostridia bacterium]|nr:ATP-binding protein [Clostridia bacterium]